MPSTASSTPNATTASTPQPNMTISPILKYNIISHTDENVDQFATIIASAFHSTPLTTIFIAEIDANKQTHALASPPFSHERRRKHFFAGINSAARDGAELVEAGDFSALALWEPAGFQGKPFVEARAGTIGEIFGQWRAAVRRMKATYLGESNQETSIGEVKLRPFYHLSFLARNPDHEAVPGAISAVLLPFLQRAREEGVPAWLEATYPHAVSVYEHFGFRICEEVVVGQGLCDERGYPCSGEKAMGVSAWGMIYDAHLR